MPRQVQSVSNTIWQHTHFLMVYIITTLSCRGKANSCWKLQPLKATAHTTNTLNPTLWTCGMAAEAGKAQWVQYHTCTYTLRVYTTSQRYTSRSLPGVQDVTVVCDNHNSARASSLWWSPSQGAKELQSTSFLDYLSICQANSSKLKQSGSWCSILVVVGSNPVQGSSSRPRALSALDVLPCLAFFFSCT